MIVVTHAFLEANGGLSTSNGGYGSNSPATLWNALDDYPNVDILDRRQLSALAAALPDSVRPSKVFVYRLLLGGQPSLVGQRRARTLPLDRSAPLTVPEGLCHHPCACTVRSPLV